MKLTVFKMNSVGGQRRPHDPRHVIDSVIANQRNRGSLSNGRPEDRAFPIFNYGSNHPQQLQDRIGGRTPTMYGAYAQGWGRVFRGYSQNWKGGVASLAKDGGRTVYGYVAYLSQAEIDKLARFEGSRYSLKPISVTLQDGRTLSAKAYIRDDNDSEYSKPSKEYLQAVVKTISSFWTSEDGGKVKVSDITLA